MAKMKPVLIDGEFREVKERSRVSDVVPSDVESILTRDGEVIPRQKFHQIAVPEGFETNLTGINKG